ncbi:MAG: hypothetical protein AAF936_04995 [Pseudomonadota bacterium]
MKSSAPWSVKGIERDARETAKEAAKREGMTVGEWLNQIIYTAGSDEETEGEIEGLKLRDLVTAVEHLNKRIGEAEAKNADSLGDLSRNVGGVVERIQRLERVKPAEGTNADLSARVEKLEKAGGDRQRIEALKALEKAVAQVAAQFNSAHKTSIERLDANERQLQTLAARIDTVGVGDQDGAGAVFLKNAIDELSERVAHAESIAAEASALKADASGSIDPDFVERTGERLRVLGDEIKRGGDQIRDLEATIVKLSAQIDAAERRSAEGVQKVTDTISEMREHFSGDAGNGVTRAEIDAAITAANQDSEEDIAALQNRIDSIVGRLGTAKSDNAADEVAAEHNDDEQADATPSLRAEEAQDVATGEEESLDEPQQTDEATLTQATDDDNETDPFAFADEIEAAIEETSEPGADFTFDLDDDGEEGSSDARTLLSEVQEVFGKRDGAKPSTEAEPASDEEAVLDESAIIRQDDTSPSAEDDLDAILADLEDGVENTAPAGDSGSNEAERNNAVEEERKAARAMLFGEPSGPEADGGETVSEGKTEKEDFLQAARRRAREAAEEAATTKPTRRKLTPKQRAILAARARQKRLTAKPVSEHLGDDLEQAPQKKEPAPENSEDTVNAPLTDAISESDDSEQAKSPVAKIKSAATALRGKLPFIGKTDEPEEKPESIKSEAPHSDEPDDELDGNSAAFATLKSTAAARPVTLALGVAIFLAAAALFFLVKDLVFKSPTANTTRPIAASPTSAPSETSSQDVGTETPSLSEIAAGPVIDPRTLYLDAVTALNNADSGEETSAAIGTLEEAAALGHPPAQLQLGELYKTGQGVDQDLGQSRTWFRRAANGGNVLAMHRIGVMTARGDGGPADTAEAIGWFELAANRGLVDSQYNLGAIYHPSDNAASSAVQDAAKAYFWYSLAAQNGDEQATPLAAGVAGALSADQRDEVDAQIAAWEAQPVDDAANEMAPLN